MSDLDELLNTFVADVDLGTRAPGAPAAIKQARQRSRRIAVAGAVVVALIVVSGGAALGILGGSERVSPADEPSLPSPEPTTMQERESPTQSPNFANTYWAKLGKTLAAAPGWSIADTDPDILAPCEGEWKATSEGGSFGTLGLGRSGPPVVNEHLVGFSSPAKASDAAVLLVKNLTSCTALEWRTQPIAQTGTVLASSAIGVVWIQQKGATVAVLQVPTTDGAPSLAVQVEVADLIRTENDLGE